MKINIKKIIISIILTTLLFLWIFFLIKLYDYEWNTINRIIWNKYYIIFLFISIILWLSLYETNNKKSKIALLIILSINLVYIWFGFLVWNIWVWNIWWIIFILLLLISILSIFIKHRIKYIIIIISCIVNIFIIYFSIIPIYNEWPNIQLFEQKFNKKLIIYSSENIENGKCIIEKDEKKYLVWKWITSHNFFINKWWSNILFKSDKIYTNTFWFIMFKWWNFVELMPQSAININQNLEIEIITWNIKYYTNNTWLFKFIWNINPILETDETNIDIVKEQYNKELKNFIKNNNINYNIVNNKTILKLSKFTIITLNKLFPWKYEKNLNNFNNYLEIIWIDIENDTTYKNEINKNEINKSIINNLKNSMKYID